MSPLIGVETDIKSIAAVHSQCRSVLFSIIEMDSVSEVARVLGIVEATVRTHLHRLFEKTATARQADLVKLVAGYCAAP